MIHDRRVAAGQPMRPQSTPSPVGQAAQAETLTSALAYRLEEVRHSYGSRTVLDIPQLGVRRGEILALVGPSGAGKSTLLRLLNFLEPPTQGRIWFEQTLVNDHDQVPLALRRSVTTVFQRPIMLSASVLENAAYGLQLRGVADAREQARAALEGLGLAHLANKSARRLSSGEMQRVALVRAMLTRPASLLLDEPTANLDPHNVRLIEQAIGDLHQQQGTTMVLVTHNIFQARRLAQRVALLLDGQVVEIADVATFFEAPRDPRTRAFLCGEIIY